MEFGAPLPSKRIYCFVFFKYCKYLETFKYQCFLYMYFDVYTTVHWNAAKLQLPLIYFVVMLGWWHVCCHICLIRQWCLPTGMWHVLLLINFLCLEAECAAAFRYCRDIWNIVLWTMHRDQWWKIYCGNIFEVFKYVQVTQHMADFYSLWNICNNPSS